ncbi:unnamed protein product [Angiostrongylus costaricensis]|uniref:Ovule protein n=1 Tax=Angiostrongylus costaricensis TaxID=334426 RepID=A0A0R3PWW2_ANGCS|nr:unnamed protein product [Angiostrongylus costaricensis]
MWCVRSTRCILREGLYVSFGDLHPTHDTRLYSWNHICMLCYSRLLNKTAYDERFSVLPS